jgi:tetratricopeptide (TPR) repeat protein
MPGTVDQSRYFKAIADLEAVGRQQPALSAWITASERWPDHPVVLLGIGNGLLQSENFVQAEDYYRRLLNIGSSSTIAGNNLSLALAGQGKFTDALSEIDRAIRENTEADLHTELLDTRAEIEALREAR